VERALTSTAERPGFASGAVARLRADRDFLSPSLARVTDYVLANTEAVVYQTITEIASSVGVSEATITRLCRRLGYPGFHAFKISLASDLASARPGAAPTGSGVGDIILQAAHQATLSIDETARVLDPAVLDRVADAIAAANRVDITGQAHSSLAAQFFAAKLMRLGITAIAQSDPHLAVVSAATLGKNSVLVAISRSGSTMDTVQNLRIAQRAGAFTVAVTNRASSPITKHAHEVLYTVSPEGPLAGGAISSLTSQLLVIEVLHQVLLNRLPGASESIRNTAEAVVEKKY
jgi:DNA-binding MurR/RpiR family transcriptional regulator